MLQEAFELLQALHWPASGLTRDMIRKRVPTLPPPIYLHLPAKKRFTSAIQALHEVETAAANAQGDYASADFEHTEAQSIADGGPPGWGPDPLRSRFGVVDGGSAEDRTPPGPEEPDDSP